MKLQGKVAVVTGAGRGIGKAIALALAREGAKVTVISRTLPKVRKTASEVESLGSRALALKVDVSAWDAVQTMVDVTTEEFSTVGILVNNAGLLGPIGPVWENDVGEWLKAAQMNLSGGGAAYGRPFFSAYASSEAALVRFTECAAREVEPYNITVNTIAPGLVDSQMQQEVLRAGSKAGEETLVKARLARGGGVSPALASPLAIFIASEEPTTLPDALSVLSGTIGKIFRSGLTKWR